MKKILLLHLVTLAFMVKALPQNIDDRLPKGDSCFIAVKATLKANISPISKTFCIGDKIAVKLRDNKIIRGKIRELSQDYINTANGYEIDVSKIKWIKKSKLTTSRAIVGGLVTVAGIAIFMPVANGDVDFDLIVPQGGLGIVLVTTGIAIFTSRAKFKIEKGDRLIFKN